MLTILTGDAIEQLRTLPDECVHCCVTSPPYWGLRDYGTAAWEGGESNCDHLDPKATQRNDTANMYGENSQHLSLKPFNGECGKCGAKRIDSQLGLEKTPEEYVAKMVEVFREVRRVLRKDGTLWLNLWDSYAQSSNSGGTASIQGTVKRMGAMNNHNRPIPEGLKPKDLCGIPWRVAFALQADGWWLRSDIIWAKPNPMPESVTDRPTKSHEYLFILTKASTYYYDAEAIKEKSDSPWNSVNAFAQPGTKNLSMAESNPGLYRTRGMGTYHPDIEQNNRNKRSVWTVATAPYPEAHFATYPPDLIKPCIMAGTSAKGCCAKCGAPWERIVEGEQTGDQRWSKNGGLHRADAPGAVLSPSSVFRTGSHNVNKTLGWQPTCKCDCGIEPCTVVDPFAGSGTTGAVALELGRKAVLIELNPKYVELIRQRCDITPGLQLA